MADTSLANGDAPAIRFLEAVADRAWPAAETARGTDWEARFSNGMHRRINSATVWASDDLAATVADLEARYRERGRLPIFKLTDGSAPGLDEHLAGIGYQPDARVTIMTSGLTGGPGTHRRGVDLEREPSIEWMDAFSSISGYGPRRRSLLPGILGRIEPAAAYAARRDAGAIVSVGLAVVDGDHGGLFEMATHPDHRGRGLASEIRDALLEWMRRRGAETAYLQVLEGNEPAERLYRGAGFSPRYQYWYRVHPDRLLITPR